jgi:hypothetical protein
VTTEEQRRQIGMLWMAMFSSIAIYGAVCVVAVGNGDGDAEATAVWRYGLSTAGVVLGALSVWWRRYFLPSDALPPRALGFAQLQGHAVVTWALSEAVGICGVVAAFVLGAAREYIPFGAAAAALLLLHRPANLPLARLQRPVP